MTNRPTASTDLRWNFTAESVNENNYADALSKLQLTSDLQPRYLAEILLKDEKFRDLTVANGLSDEGIVGLCQRTISSLGMTLRQDLRQACGESISRIDLLGIRVLQIDWSKEAGFWINGETKIAPFNVREAVEFTAEHIAGQPVEMAALTAELILPLLRASEILIPRLKPLDSSGSLHKYEWQSAKLSC